MLLFGILYKYRSTCESEDLKVTEEFDNIFMAITKMTTMTFIKNHHNFLMAYFLKILVIVIFCNSTIQLLNSSNYDFRITT